MLNINSLPVSIIIIIVCWSILIYCMSKIVINYKKNTKMYGKPKQKLAGRIVSMIFVIIFILISEFIFIMVFYAGQLILKFTGFPVKYIGLIQFISHCILAMIGIILITTGICITLLLIYFLLYAIRYYLIEPKRINDKRKDEKEDGDNEWKTI